MLQAVLPYIIGIQPSQTVASTPEPLKHRVPSSTGNSAYCHARSKDIDGGDRQCRLAASSSPATIPSLYASGSIDLEALGIHRALLDLGEILTYFQDEGKELASRTCEGLLRLQLETTATLAMVNARMICCHRLSQLYSTMLPPTYIFEVGSRILPAAFRAGALSNRTVSLWAAGVGSAVFADCRHQALCLARSAASTAVFFSSGYRGCREG